jgi:ATP/ADP translocase
MYADFPQHLHTSATVLKLLFLSFANNSVFTVHQTYKYTEVFHKIYSLVDIMASKVGGMKIQVLSTGGH